MMFHAFHFLLRVGCYSKKMKRCRPARCPQLSPMAVRNQTTTYNIRGRHIKFEYDQNAYNSIHTLFGGMVKNVQEALMLKDMLEEEYCENQKDWDMRKRSGEIMKMMFLQLIIDKAVSSWPS